ncbi:MAG: single-stranded-DNA-specific exonuclease RecJ, partial [Parvularculaceae bacterium]|nr:single-stranded-DNA-specific exonuclease RecJ [Parvularculaceae bacterium]
ATATAILVRFARMVGANATAYLPDRILEGYGPSLEAFRSLAREGAKVIVTVDCGANAHSVVGPAAREGFEVIVVDHHLMSGPPPEGVFACVNPNRPDDVSGLGGLSAAGLAFLAAVAVNRELRLRGWFRSRPEPDLLSLLDLAALGLVCDVMPMTGVARVMTAQGLKVLAAGGNKGLAALSARAGAKGAPSTYTLGFLLGPRVNAAGRIGHARLALELLTTDDAGRAEALAEKLHLLNAERQAVEQTVLDAAIAAAERHGRPTGGVVLASGEGWHPGVIGVVAGRLKERYDLPAIVVSLDGALGKGSGRSIEGVDLGGVVNAAREGGLLVAGGGHAMAAGLTIETARLGDFAAFLGDRLGTIVETARAGRAEWADGVVGPDAVTARFAAMIAALGPFGPGNPEPNFVIADAVVKDARPIGSAHLALTLSNLSGRDVRAVVFRARDGAIGALLENGRRAHVLGKIRVDDWRGGDAAQFQIVDVGVSV